MGRDIFNQLLGCYCLSCIDGVDGCRKPVTAIDLYYARYGLLYRLPIRSFVDRHRFPVLLKWFTRREQRGNSAVNARLLRLTGTSRSEQKTFLEHAGRSGQPSQVLMESRYRGAGKISGFLS